MTILYPVKVMFTGDSSAVRLTGGNSAHQIYEKFPEITHTALAFVLTYYRWVSAWGSEIFRYNYVRDFVTWHSCVQHMNDVPWKRYTGTEPHRTFPPQGCLRNVRRGKTYLAVPGSRSRKTGKTGENRGILLAAYGLSVIGHLYIYILYICIHTLHSNKLFCRIACALILRIAQIDSFIFRVWWRALKINLKVL
jgi:hypothetical protein